jgi:Arc/MetJ-type ribon-helix-helix transcriptional regulator
MSVDTGHRKHSVTLPTETSEAITARVGKREFSAYVARAAARQLERDALDDVLARMEVEHGPVDRAEVDAIAERLTGR